MGKNHPPAVVYPVRRPDELLAGLALLWLLGGLGLWLWRWRAGLPTVTLGVPTLWFNGLVVILWLTCGVRAAMQWWTAPAGLLRWDGLSWQWEPTSGAPQLGGQLFVGLDLQQRLLLGWQAPQDKPAVLKVPVLWLWVDGKNRHERWHTLRCAVYFRGSIDKAAGDVSLAALGETRVREPLPSSLV
jgi:hypothetical protein